MELDDPCVVILREFVEDVQDEDRRGGLQELDHGFVMEDYGVMKRGLKVEINLAEKVKLGENF